MSADVEVQSGLAGVVAFATEIAEPDRAGGAPTGTAPPSMGREGRRIRPTAKYVGPPPRPLSALR